MATIARVVSAGLIAVAVVFGSAGISGAEPNNGGNKWNQRRYDECVKSLMGQRYCCEQAGGEWIRDLTYDSDGDVVGHTYRCKGKPPSAEGQPSQPVGAPPAGVATEPPAAPPQTGPLVPVAPLPTVVNPR
ncbi:hypothetical protein [Mycolicibacterium elephantis]|uniref:hypothetical protein n=1 Tax=Mycolicibacterium elephantis TaxID=81858 RepID=UPI003A876C41